MIDLKLALKVQEIAFNAWPPEKIEFLNGWRLRISDGTTYRANSVFPCEYTGSNVIKDILASEEIYFENNLPIIFQLSDLSEPYDLNDQLKSLGYREIIHTNVFITTLDKICRPLYNKNYEILISWEITDEWSTNLKNILSLSESHTKGINKTIRRIKDPQTFFLMAKIEKETVGVCLGTLESEFLGIYNLAVFSHLRRQGIGTALILKLLDYVKKVNYKYTYLQVEQENQTAMKLYKNLGFKQLFSYHYMVKY